MKIHATEDFAHVVALDRPVAYGETVEIDDELAEALLAQPGWSKKAPPKRAKGDDAPDPLFDRNVSAPVFPPETSDDVDAAQVVDEDASTAAPSEEN